MCGQNHIKFVSVNVCCVGIISLRQVLLKAEIA